MLAKNAIVKMNKKSRREVTVVESPCVRNCCLDDNDICWGCFRSLAEITQWTLVDEKTQQEFLKNCLERKIQRKASVKY